jgi:predicted transposase/invertase (TIGR01784 family)
MVWQLVLFFCHLLVSSSAISSQGTHIQVSAAVSARQADENYGCFQGQVYGVPTFDSTFKHVLNDTEICLDFVKVFGNLPDVKSLRLLDDSLNPIKELTAARNLLNERKNIALLKKIHTTNYKDIKLQCVSTKRGADGLFVTETLDGSFLVQLGKVFGDIRDAFPPQNRDSKLDLVCELETGEHVLIEVQVITQDFWDSRALAYASYASAFYGNRLKRGGAWTELKRVIAINFLGKGGTRDVTDPWREFPDEVMRHYVLQDVENPDEGHIMKGFELIQYCVPHLHKAARTDEKYREWADFFQNADERTEAYVKQLSTEAVKKAYERARVSTMPREIRQSYIDDTAKYGGYLNSILKERDEVQKKFEALLETEKRKGEAALETLKTKREAETRKNEALRCRLVNLARRMLTNGDSEATVLTETGLKIEEITEIRASVSNGEGGGAPPSPAEATVLSPANQPNPGEMD